MHQEASLRDRLGSYSRVGRAARRVRVQLRITYIRYVYQNNFDIMILPRNGIVAVAT